MRKVDKDAFGHEMFDYLNGEACAEIIERDDGYMDYSGGPQGYFRDYKDWPGFERQAMKYAKGRVLDIGCGAGRHSLYLQKRGLDVTGIDNSPLVIEVCKRRGLKKVRLMGVTQASSRLGTFDTILMLGNNLGLLGNPKRAKWLLRRFHAMTSEHARIIGQTMDPYKTKNPDHRAYHRLNRSRGRMPGHVKIRVRYRRHIGDWFEYLFVSKGELKGILTNTGWKASKFLDSKEGHYIAIIEKEE